VKIAFDEHIPPTLVKAVQALAEESGPITAKIVTAKDYVQPGDPKGDDTPWVQRFAVDGGKVIVSGDRQMRARLHERKALSDAGITVVFFSSTWSQKNAFVKCAMLLNWWPKIWECVNNAKPGECFEIPFQWNWTELRRMELPTATPPKVRKPRARRRQGQSEEDPQATADRPLLNQD